MVADVLDMLMSLCKEFPGFFHIRLGTDYVVLHSPEVAEVNSPVSACPKGSQGVGRIYIDRDNSNEAVKVSRKSSGMLAQNL